MENKQQQIIPIQYIPITPCEEDEIDLKEVIKTILKYKKFIIIFTFLITFLSALYAFMKAPIYETKATLEIGYINKNDNKSYILTPQAIKVFIKNNFDNSENDTVKYPQVNVNFLKNTKEILNLDIYTFSNKEGKEYLNKILSSVNKKEDKRINIYINNIKSQVRILKEYLISLQNQIKNLNKQLNTTTEPNIYKTILENIENIQNEIIQTKLKISQLKSLIFPINITKTHTIGKIIQHNLPIKPKKKLIIIVAFITGLILSIFLVFFIEFIKSFKEETI